MQGLLIEMFQRRDVDAVAVTTTNLTPMQFNSSFDLADVGGIFGSRGHNVSELGCKEKALPSDF